MFSFVESQSFWLPDPSSSTAYEAHRTEQIFDRHSIHHHGCECISVVGEN